MEASATKATPNAAILRKNAPTALATAPTTPTIRRLVCQLDEYFSVRESNCEQSGSQDARSSQWRMNVEVARRNTS